MEHRNVAGEIFAVKNLLEFCLENEESRVCIHYDYEGLEKYRNYQDLMKLRKETVYEDMLAFIEDAAEGLHIEKEMNSFVFFWLGVL